MVKQDSNDAGFTKCGESFLARKYPFSSNINLASFLTLSEFKKLENDGASIAPTNAAINVPINGHILTPYRHSIQNRLQFLSQCLNNHTKRFIWQLIFLQERRPHRLLQWIIRKLIG